MVLRQALTAAAADVLAAGGYLPGTPADIGCMSGALRHFSGGICYPCLAATRRRPSGLTCTATRTPAARYARPVSITAGLQWRAVRPPACVTGAPGKQDLQACW